jgi:hypothetical protein
MVAELKPETVAEFLRNAFPGDYVQYVADKSRKAYFYRIAKPSGEQTHRIYVVYEFVSDRTPEQILALLGRWNLRGTLKRSGRVQITKAGIEAIP